MKRRGPKPKHLLFDKAPHLRDEWDYEKNDGIDPEELSSGSGVYAWWKCAEGHGWKGRISTRGNENKGCKECYTSSQIAAAVAANPLTSNPEVARQLDDPNYVPSDLSLSSAKKVWWKCDDGHRWESSPSSRISGGVGCPFCSGRYPIPGETDLATLRPDLAAQWVDESLSPKDVTIRSTKKVRWRCENHHEWVTAITNRTWSRTKGNGCPYCSGGRYAKVLAGVNDLATLYPDIASELHSATVSASEIRPYVNTKLEWKCGKGHIWSALVSTRTKNGSGCPSCALARTSKVEKRLRKLVSDHEGTSNTILEDNHTLPVPCRRRKTVTVDVYCEWDGLPVVVEYDGAYWHHSDANVSRDTDKTSALLEHNYIVVRFRENKLAHLGLEHPNLLQINVQYDKDEDTSLEEAISKMEAWLNDR